jgi:hypothetical protein
MLTGIQIRILSNSLRYAAAILGVITLLGTAGCSLDELSVKHLGTQPEILTNMPPGWAGLLK